MARNGGSAHNSERVEAQGEDECDDRNVGVELAKAFQELAKGERTASALETRLDDIESRIDQLLASVEQNANNTTQIDATDKPTLESEGSAARK